jgi:DNA-binding beta-propeller fold protein YncE
MKKYLLCFYTLVISLSLLFCSFSVSFAEIEWDIIDKIPVTCTPLDTAISSDGSVVYILCSKNILLFSTREKKVTDTIPITENFTQMALTSDGKGLLLTDSAKKQLSIMQISEVYNIPVGTSPVIGKKDASVSVFAFMDYQ